MSATRLPAIRVSLATRKLVAELLGTFILVVGGVGSAVVGIRTHGGLAVAIAFGLVLTFGVYAFGPVSGCHVNPAVTLAMFLHGVVTVEEALGYWSAQFVGGFLGAGMLELMVKSFKVRDQTGALGTNDYGANINLAGALVVEGMLTAIFVLVILLVTDRVANAALAGIAIGAALTLVHLVGLSLTGTSVNPARSLGPAIWNGGDPLKHVWVFIVAPLAGGVIAALIYPFTQGGDTVMASTHRETD
jgi:aquaporin Z